jgi:hypothetical protein
MADAIIQTLLCAPDDQEEIGLTLALEASQNNEFGKFADLGDNDKSKREWRRTMLEASRTRTTTSSSTTIATMG